MNVLVLPGSLRAASSNRVLAAAALGLLPEGARGSVADYLGELPFYSEELDTVTPPEAVARLRAELVAADAIVVVTPEYNGSLSAVLKNAIDWASRPRGASSLDAKPAAVLAAAGSPRAAEWARQDAVKILRVAGALPLETTIGVGSAYQAFAETGELRDAELAGTVRDLLARLVRDVATAA